MNIDDARIRLAVEAARGQYMTAHSPAAPEAEREVHINVLLGVVQTLGLLGIEAPIREWAAEIVNERKGGG